MNLYWNCVFMLSKISIRVVKQNSDKETKNKWL